jgi:hypothetical protein
MNAQRFLILEQTWDSPFAHHIGHGETRPWRIGRHDGEHLLPAMWLT